MSLAIFCRLPCYVFFNLIACFTVLPARWCSNWLATVLAVVLAKFLPKPVGRREKPLVSSSSNDILSSSNKTAVIAAAMRWPPLFTYSSTLTDVRLPLSLVWGAKRTWRKPSHPLPSTRNMKERGPPHPQKSRGRLVTGGLLTSDKVGTLTRKPLAVGKISRQLRLFWARRHRVFKQYWFCAIWRHYKPYYHLNKGDFAYRERCAHSPPALPHTMSFPKPNRS